MNLTPISYDVTEWVHGDYPYFKFLALQLAVLEKTISQRPYGTLPFPALLRRLSSYVALLRSVGFSHIPNSPHVAGAGSAHYTVQPPNGSVSEEYHTE